MAELEAQPQRAEIYRRLAATEESHAAFWRKHLTETGIITPPPRPGWRTRFLIWVAKRFGPGPGPADACTRWKRSTADHYDRQPESGKTLMPAQERSHARVLSRLSGKVRAAWDGAAYSSLEGRHGAGGGNALRAAVLGANDGLVSNLSLVMGVAGAAFSQQTVLVTGLAGLIAGACSMAMGEVAVGDEARASSTRSRSPLRPTSSRRCPTRSKRSWSSSTSRRAWTARPPRTPRRA